MDFRDLLKELFDVFNTRVWLQKLDLYNNPIHSCLPSGHPKAKILSDEIFAASPSDRKALAQAAFTQTVSQSLKDDSSAPSLLRSLAQVESKSTSGGRNRIKTAKLMMSHYAPEYTKATKGVGEYDWSPYAGSAPSHNPYPPGPPSSYNAYPQPVSHLRAYANRYPAPERRSHTVTTDSYRPRDSNRSFGEPPMHPIMKDSYYPPARHYADPSPRYQYSSNTYREPTHDPMPMSYRQEHVFVDDFVLSSSNDSEQDYYARSSTDSAQDYHMWDNSAITSDDF